jgi:ABC-type Na+ transport system ATPase subunit NatA
MTNFILGIFGNLGSGKTLLASILAYAFKQKNYKIYANYNLKISDYYIDLSDPQNFINIFKKINNKEKNLIVLDELYIFMDSRASASIRNRIYDMIVLQSRKLNLNIIHTEQDPKSIDLRLRLITNYYLYTEFDKKENILYITLFDNLYAQPIKKLKIENVDKFFNLYDTTQKIKDDFNDYLEKLNKKNKKGEIK